MVGFVNLHWNLSIRDLCQMMFNRNSKKCWWLYYYCVLLNLKNTFQKYSYYWVIYSYILNIFIIGFRNTKILGLRNIPCRLYILDVILKRKGKIHRKLSLISRMNVNMSHMLGSEMASEQQISRLLSLMVA